MFFKFPLLIAMVLYIIYPDTGIDVIIGYLLGFFSVNFYWLLANVLMGNRDVILTTDVTISEIFQIRFICIGASALMYMTGNIPVFYFTLPFVPIGLVCDITITLIKLGFLEYIDKEDEE